MTFTEQSKSSTSWSNTSKASSTFTNASRSGGVRLFGDVPLSEIEANTFDGLLQGRPVGDWLFTDVYDAGAVVWNNQLKSV